MRYPADVSRRWWQNPSPLIETDGVRTHSGEAGQFAAVKMPSFGNGTHSRSLRVGTGSRNGTSWY
jgi:hypothetical protein